MSRRRDFLILSAVTTMLWIAASLPRMGMADHRGADWSAGWPVEYQTWGKSPDGSEYGYLFWPRAVALDVAWWLWSLLVVWVVVGLWVRQPATHQRLAVPQNRTGGKAEPVAAPDPAT